MGLAIIMMLVETSESLNMSLIDLLKLKFLKKDSILIDLIKLIDKYPLLLLFIQPIFMASNLIVARGAVEYLPPISRFLEMDTGFYYLFLFTHREILEKVKYFKKNF